MRIFKKSCKLIGKTREENYSNFYPSPTKENYKERREIIILTAPIIEEFDRVASNGSLSMENGANLWDHRGEEVMLELKYSVARLTSLEEGGVVVFCEWSSKFCGENSKFGRF